MSCSEIINICVSVVSIFIALLALFQTKQQITLSNKQQLFDRRLTRYLELNTIYWQEYDPVSAVYKHGNGGDR